MPARGIAEIRHLARGVRRVQRVREPNGARARGAALRASGLFRRRCREFERRLLNPSTQHDDRQVPLSPRNSERHAASWCLALQGPVQGPPNLSTSLFRLKNRVVCHPSPPTAVSSAIPTTRSRSGEDRKSTRLNSSHVKISYAV